MPIVEPEITLGPGTYTIEVCGHTIIPSHSCHRCQGGGGSGSGWTLPAPFIMDRYQHMSVLLSVPARRHQMLRSAGVAAGCASSLDQTASSRVLGENKRHALLCGGHAMALAMTTSVS